jgi:outer membrane protein assembly factor BamB
MSSTRRGPPQREGGILPGNDAKVSKERWLYSYPALFKNAAGGNGPRATPTIAGNEVFSPGATGLLVCLDLLTGQKRWATRPTCTTPPSVRNTF